MRMPSIQTRRLLRDAANTICQLHDDLQRANAENDKLREQIHWLERCDVMHVLTDQEYIDQCERERLMQVSIDALDTENAKLRELVNAFDWCTENFDMPYRCDQCPLKQTDAIGPECEVLMRELGIKE